MSRIRLALALIVLLPAAAPAQRGGGGGGGSSADGTAGGFKGGKKADWSGVEKSTLPPGPSISGKDFEKASPLADLLDKKKDLKLSDAQVTTLKEADSKLREANAARFKLVDSLKKEMKPGPESEDEARVVIAREAMMGVVRDIRTSFDAAAKDAVATFDEAQQKTAQDVLKKNAEEMQELLRNKMGGGGRGGPPGGRGRGGQY